MAKLLTEFKGAELVPALYLVANFAVGVAAAFAFKLANPADP